jgi:2-haloacid dehalogenase
VAKISVHSGYNTGMNYTWLFFDADGTLFDYDKAEEKALSATFVELGIPFEEAYGPLYRRFNADVWKEFEAGQTTAKRLRVERFERLFSAAGIQADADEFGRRYLPNLAHGSDLMPGAAETLDALKPRYRMALITNGLKDVQRPRLERSGIAGFFEAVAISEEIEAAKPHAAYFDALFAQIGSPPRSQALVIGDGLTSDIQGANDYGLDACWFNARHLPADPRYPAKYEIHELTELLPILLS